jgi:AraC-like DNA-binding protein
MQYRCFSASTMVREAFSRLRAEYREQKLHAAVAARAVLHQIWIGVLRDHHAAADQRQTRGQPHSAVMRRATDWIAAHLHEDFPIDAAADAVGLGISRFHERFLDEVGLTPNEYRTRLRIRRGRDLLTHTNRPITRIAHELGFGSSQYFATVFGRIVGMSPRAYRRKYSNESAE